MRNAALFILAASLTGCCRRATMPANGSSATSRPVQTNEAATVLAAWMEAFNQEDHAKIMALLSDDIVLVGSGGCKGKPCVGKEAVEQGMVRETLSAHIHVMGFEITDTRGDSAWAMWAAEPPAEIRPPGVQFIRGRVGARVHGGKLTFIDFSYDLTDPSTVMARALFGEISFALQPAGSSVAVNAPARGLLAPMKTQTAISLHANDSTRKDATMSARLVRGVCAKLGDVAYELGPFTLGRSDTILAVEISDLLAQPISAVIADNGKPIACGQLPFALKQSWLPGGGQPPEPLPPPSR